MMSMITEHPAHFIGLCLAFTWHGRVNYRSSSAPGSPPPPTTNATGQRLTTIPPDGHPRNPSSSDIQRAVMRNTDTMLGAAVASAHTKADLRPIVPFCFQLAGTGRQNVF
jgi:hypothetical protein